MTKFKSGFVTLIGRTNVGKSTLLNLLVGEKVAAIANKVQTTRTAIKGIVNRENSQIIFIDTPGIHKPKTKLNETMIETSFGSLADSDIILFLIEATSNEIGRGDTRILEKIKEAKRKTILIINKIDLVKREKLLSLIDLYRKEYDFEAVIPISATNRKYKEIILDEREKNLNEGPAYYDIEEYTDQTLRQLAEETIREKALKLLQDEVPHGIYVEVEKMKQRKNKKGEDIYDIEATIYCLRNSHKGIIIGKNGQPQCNAVQQTLFFFYQSLQPQHNQREKKNAVQPHNIPAVCRHVSGKGIKYAEKSNPEIFDPVVAAEIIGKACTGQTGFKHDHVCHKFNDIRLWTQYNKPVERAGQIIGIKGGKINAHSDVPAVEKTASAGQLVSELRKKRSVLMIHVGPQKRLLAKGKNPPLGKNDDHNDDRNKKSRQNSV